MFSVAIGKMLRNKGLFICLLIACIFSVALIACLPAFENAITKRMLHQELLDEHYRTGSPPLLHNVRIPITHSTDGIADSSHDANVHGDIVRRFGLPVISIQTTYALDLEFVYHVLPGDIEELPLTRGAIAYTDGIYDHVELIAGRFPDQIDDPDMIEVVVSERVAAAAPFMLDSVYNRRHLQTPQDEGLKFRVVGVFREIDPSDLFWVQTLPNITLYTSYESIMKAMFYTNSETRGRWAAVLDYRYLEPANVRSIVDLLDERVYGTLNNSRFLVRALERQGELRPMLLILQTPCLALIALLIIMLSGLILDNDRVEISLLYSRGAGKSRVIAMYAIQALLLAGAAIAAGIPLSALLCTLLGASTDFLDFQGRSLLEVTVTTDVILYAVAGAGVFIVSMLLPIVFSKSVSIVVQRRAKAARGSRPFYEKFFLDIILIGISVYSINSHLSLQERLAELGVEASEYAVDPQIFLMSTCFFAGMAMLFSRLYPYIIRVLFRLGRSLWPPPIYASLSAARSRHRSRYIMLFIITTVSTGIFSASAARTINRNNDDNAMYDIGADIVVMENWQFYDPLGHVQGRYGSAEEPRMPPYSELFFSEVPFGLFEEPDGVALATKVYRNDNGNAMYTRIGGGAVNVTILAINPDEFAQVSWWRDDMYDYHFNHMMNAMSSNPYVVLVSRNMADNRANRPLIHGEPLIVLWDGHEARSSPTCYVYDSVEFFPTWSPVTSEGRPANLIVMNYELIKRYYRLEPYEVWIKTEDDASGADIMQYYFDNRDMTLFPQHRLVDNHVRAPRFLFEDAQIDLDDIRSHPNILSMNGFLTLNFMMVIAIMASGFLIFWYLDFRSRKLQISIMRSAGMPQRGVIAMLLWEQVLLSILPLVAGFVLGRIGASMFVPMLGAASEESALPFMIHILADDSVRIGAIVLGVILISIAILTIMAARMKISQTLKLGEE